MQCATEKLFLGTDAMIKPNKIRNFLRKTRYGVLSRIHGKESEQARPSQTSIQD